MGRKSDIDREYDEKEPTTIYLQEFVLNKIRRPSKANYMSVTGWIERAINRELMAEMESPEMLRIVCDEENGKSKAEKIK
jgi:hypothetical protein